MSHLVANNLTKHVVYCQLNGENVVRIHRHVHASKSIITTSLEYCTNYINCDYFQNRTLKAKSGKRTSDTV